MAPKYQRCPSLIVSGATLHVPRRVQPRPRANMGAGRKRVPPPIAEQTLMTLQQNLREIEDGVRFICRRHRRIWEAVPVIV